ncbi:MAG: hypothetical protein ACRELB_13780, partial [Polyangiaceae bacterium]
MAMETFRTAILGRTGRRVGRLGIAASYGLGGAGVEAAIDSGVSYIYWGSLRKREFGRGVRAAIARGRRDDLTIVVQSYSRLGSLVRPSLECALRALGIDHADVLLLGWWNRRPPARILDAALRCKERGLVRHLALSTHHRPLAGALADDSPFEVLHVRYNACHRGAEREVFTSLPAARDPAGTPRAAGIVAFTATRWGTLLAPPPDAPPDLPVPRAGDCYRFVLSNPAVDVCMTGLADEAQLRHALAALEKGPMTEEELTWMRHFGDVLYRGGKGARNLV